MVLPMVNKSFVSIFFSPTTLQVLQLDGSKKRVKKSLSVALPGGLIQNYRVVDEESLAKIIKTIWKKLGLRERFVGIVVPEFSTFTKLLTLPRIELEELDEAVRWQAEDFLATDPSNVVLDWKIIKEGKKSFQILAVSIEKEILQGYVESAELAGLFPLVVETPSLSLARISDGKPSGRLVLYESYGEAILIVAQGPKIMGSSVADITNHDEVIKVCARMIEHYHKAKVTRIIIGGSKLDKVLIDKLQKTLGKPAEWMKLGIGGLPAEKLQEYLIPISLQLKDPAEPLDESTVNLLPNELVRKYEHGKLKLQVWSLTLFVTLVVWFCFLSTLGVYFFLGQQMEVFRKTSALQKIPPEKAEIINQIKEINQISDKVSKITNISYSPQVILNAIARAQPPGITIIEHRLDLETGKIQIEGVSASRQDIVGFKRALEEQNDFSLVSIPISSFEAEKDFEFGLSFIYLPVVSKKPAGMPTR